jgi:hypothetical protein
MLFCKESDLKSIEIIYSIVYLLSTAIRFVIMIPYRKSILHGGAAVPLSNILIWIIDILIWY